MRKVAVLLMTILMVGCACLPSKPPTMQPQPSTVVDDSWMPKEDNSITIEPDNSITDDTNNSDNSYNSTLFWENYWANYNSDNTTSNDNGSSSYSGYTYWNNYYTPPTPVVVVIWAGTVNVTR